MPRHDVAIYAPHANQYYERARVRTGGGAERQTFLLARNLARCGVRVAHVVYAVDSPEVDPKAPVTLVQRPHPQEYGSARAFARETAEVWRSLSEADAGVQVFRGASGAVGVGGLWARLRRRRLVFAGANNGDFTGGSFHGPRDPRAQMFAAGMRMTHAGVVQSADQIDLARTRFPHLRAQQIASFVEPAPATEDGADGFLWVSRLAAYKRPLLYADLAAALPEARFWMIPVEIPEPGQAEMLAELQRRSRELPNLELLPQRSHADLQDLIGHSVAMVNTSSYEGMPNTWLEGWARGVPALTLSFDPDGRIAENGLGVSADGSWEAFVTGARELWTRRGDRDELGARVRAYVADVHGEQVTEQWIALLAALGA